MLIDSIVYLNTIKLMPEHTLMLFLSGRYYRITKGDYIVDETCIGAGEIRLQMAMVIIAFICMYSCNVESCISLVYA